MPGMQWNSKGHTNHLVPFYAKGAAAESFVFRYAGKEDLVRGAYLDNRHIGRNILRFLK